VKFHYVCYFWGKRCYKIEEGGGGCEYKNPCEGQKVPNKSDFQFCEPLICQEIVHIIRHSKNLYIIYCKRMREPFFGLEFLPKEKNKTQDRAEQMKIPKRSNCG
jgi:hypothetical protein